MLIDLILALVVLGVVLYLVTLLPIDDRIKQIIHVVVIIAALLYVLQMFGLFGHSSRLLR